MKPPLMGVSRQSFSSNNFLRVSESYLLEKVESMKVTLEEVRSM